MLVMVGSVAGCVATPPDRPDDPATAVLRIDRSGGFGPLSARYRVPALVVYGDGSAIVAGQDQGAVFTARRRMLTDGELSGLFEQAARANLFEDNAYGLDVLDAASLSVRIRSTEGTFRTQAGLQSETGGDDRRRIVEFAAAAEQVGTEAGEYAPDRYAVVVLAEAAGREPVRPWPLPVPPEQVPGWPARPCLEIDAAAAGDLLAAARSADHQTSWRAGDRQVSLVIRPLLPDEPGCAALR
ncbi:hypothetical protein [Plantactinospora soyae]|uniref:Uncharacterized protein n=1 Tax=Plantactinospora soyae TaxID=1544732 RepID=A0A927R2G4_9ACTN|nr:hypothetical protein [Plantactinospora soyae]MBE1490753.1 hypothetical protein [Plantactinospora soyae]